VNAVGGYAIAHILRSPNQTDPQVTVANARLIAASPDLLEKLKAALPYVERVAATAPTEPSRIQKQREASKTAAEIRAAIAKATESES
jgi:cell envelope opacity-associated protein A